MKTPDPFFPKSTDVRFSMRSLMLASVIMATLIAAAGWLAKDSSHEQSVRVGFFWGGALVSALAWLGLFALQRSHSERLAGRRLFRFEHASRALPRISNLLTRAAIVVYVILMPWALLRHTYRVAIGASIGPTFVDVLAGFLIGLLLASVAPALWWRNGWITERGLLRGVEYIPWQHFDGFCEHPRDANVLVLSGPLRRSAIRIPPGAREAVETVLREKLGDEKET